MACGPRTVVKSVAVKAHDEKGSKSPRDALCLVW